MQTKRINSGLRKFVMPSLLLFRFGGSFAFPSGCRMRRRIRQCVAALPMFLFPLLVCPSTSEAQAPRVGGTELSAGVFGPIRSFDTLDSGLCYSFELRKQEAVDKETPIPIALGWTTSGFWREAELHLADHTFAGLLRVFPGGLIRQSSVSLPFASAGQGQLSGLSLTKIEGDAAAVPNDSSFMLKEPQYVHPRPAGGFIVREISEQRVYFVDEHGDLDGQPIQVKRCKSEECEREASFTDPAGRTVILTGVKRSVPVRDGIFTLVEIEDEAGEAKTSFAYLDRLTRKYYPLDVAAKFSDPSESIDDLRRKFYHLDFSYLDAVADVAYVLVMERNPWLAQVDFGGSRWQNPPVRRLELPASLGFQYEKPLRDYEEIRRLGSQQAVIDWMFESYRAVELQRVPVGLHVWNNRLFLLAKSEAGSNGSTAWQLVELSLENGQQIGTAVDLPTNAAHVAIVPGGEYFALLEKGGIETLDLRFRRILYRQTQSAVLFPVAWLPKTGGLSKVRGHCEPILSRF